MEPVSQAILGVMGQGLYRKKSPLGARQKALFGALGGMAPDLDYIIRLPSDPLFTIEYHRQFTHSLFFIPFGSLIVSLFLRLFKIPVKVSYPFVLLGFATHGLLDAFTNYGTQLWWPFSDKREAWNCVAVVDPFITLPLIFLTYFFVKHNKIILNYFSWLLLCSYLFLGHIQKERVRSFLTELNILNKNVERVMIKPTLLNNYVWRVIVDSGNELSFYGVRLGFFSGNMLVNGETVKKVLPGEILQKIDSNSLQYRDYERFKYFTDDYLFWVNEYEIGDARYSFLPHGTKPIWSISFMSDFGMQKLNHVILNTDNKITPKLKDEFIKYW